MPRDYYEILGVERKAGDNDIKKAFRNLARQYHPDVNKSPDAETKFKEINEAYQILSDPQKRRAYDQFGHAGVNMGGGAGAAYGDPFTIFEDLMQGFGFSSNRRGTRGKRARQGRDLRYDLELTFEQAVFGADVDIEVQRWETCEVCDGNGAKPGTAPKTCPTCKGSGQIHQRRQTLLGEMVMATDCSTCNGKGTIIEAPCETCDGRGKIRKTRKLAVNIPAGVDDGTQIRLSGEGDPGENGGPPGNLYVVLTVRQHQFLKRRGSDILLEWNINVAQAALGDTVIVPTLDGEEEIKIKAGTQSGTILTLRNKGVPKLRPDGTSQGRGDQLVVVNVFVPNKLTAEQKQLFEQLAHTFDPEAVPQHNSRHDKNFFDRVASFFSGE